MFMRERGDKKKSFISNRDAFPVPTKQFLVILFPPRSLDLAGFHEKPCVNQNYFAPIRARIS